VADTGDEVVAAPLRRDAGAERVRRLGLAVAGDVVELALDREERGLRDRLRPHPLAAHLEAAVRQVVLLEHPVDGVEVVLRRHV
jgi:hypothetical protein